MEEQKDKLELEIPEKVTRPGPHPERRPLYLKSG